jgi:hypothetical protein
MEPRIEDITSSFAESIVDSQVSTWLPESACGFCSYFVRSNMPRSHSAL